jgi:UPF0755 protein
VLRLGIVLVGVVLAIYGPLLIWAHLPGPGAAISLPGGAAISLGSPCTAEHLAEQLAERQLIRSPGLFRIYLTLAHPAFHCVEHDHPLTADLSASELVNRIDGSPFRTSVRVPVPEGLSHMDLATRFEETRVSSSAEFLRAARDPALLAELGIGGSSAEGYLFPATYTLLADSDPKDVIRTLVAEAKKRLAKLRTQHPGAFEVLEQRGMSERDVLTLASIVEKEARLDDERPLIASVFFNRLNDPEFRPARMLQSDPTASYACRIPLPEVPSCAGFHGSVTPAMLRDASNPYNTYRHPGLPPGPISNPGEASIVAVLAPAQTDYLYFVTKGGGRHTFSKTFGEHREAIESAH